MEQLEQIDQLRDAFTDHVFENKNIAEFLRLLAKKDSSFYLSDGAITVIDDLLETTASTNRLDLMKLLVEHGANIHATRYKHTPVGVISRAASNADINMITWLVEHGAQINHPVEGHQGSMPLLAAVGQNKFDIVKYLVEHGAIINFINRGRLSPLDYAKPGSEVAEFLIAHGAKTGKELPDDHLPPTPPSPDTLLQHLEKYHHTNVKVFPLHEIVPGDTVIRILHIPDFEHNYQALVTDGMSEQIQIIPKGEHEEKITHLRTELYISLPKSWPLNEEAMQQHHYRWPYEWLRKIAAWPFENNTYLRRASIFANGEPPKPLSEDTKQSCMLVAWADNDWSIWKRPDGESVHLMVVTPLYTEERDYEKKYGIVELLKQLQDTSTAVDLERPIEVPKE